MPRSSQKLNNVHVMYGAVERCSSTQKYYYPVKLCFQDKTRKRQVYFDSAECQKRWVTNIIRAQGFLSQEDQYDAEISSMQVVSNTTATHKVTGAEYEMKVANKEKLKEIKC